MGPLGDFLADLQCYLVSTQVMFILTALMYLLGVTIEQPLLFVTTTSLMFVAITLINIRGMRFSSVFSNAGAVISTLVPMMVLVCLAVYCWQPVILQQQIYHGLR